MKLFSHRLRKLREEKKLKQSELANAIGVSQRTISSWENAVVQPSLALLKRIANFFCVSSDYLIGNDEETHKAFAFHRCESALATIHGEPDKREWGFFSNYIHYVELCELKKTDYNAFLKSMAEQNLHEQKPFENIYEWNIIKGAEQKVRLSDKAFEQVCDISPRFNDGYAMVLKAPVVPVTKKSDVFSRHTAKLKKEVDGVMDKKFGVK